MDQRPPSPPSPPPRWGPVPGTPDPMSVDTGGGPTSDLSPYNTPGMITPPKSSSTNNNNNMSGVSPASSKRSNASSEEPENRLEDVKTYFTNAGLKFRKAIATGNHGGTLLFDKFEKSNSGTTTPPILEKSLVVKYALDTRDDASTNNDEDLSNEMFWLEKFVHAQHIIQLEPEYRKLWYEEKEGAGWIMC
ncbi:hypothetical protein PG993_000225 [Apiospora rasikravindrae]|uniref:Uncharacterized protein n=1 Tax=Apiospora rasikravindrae TaxID=990691 RepID=A0ABR1U7Z3_9PEZI